MYSDNDGGSAGLQTYIFEALPIRGDRVWKKMRKDERELEVTRITRLRHNSQCTMSTFGDQHTVAVASVGRRISRIDGRRRALTSRA